MYVIISDKILSDKELVFVHVFYCLSLMAECLGSTDTIVYSQFTSSRNDV